MPTKNSPRKFEKKSTKPVAQPSSIASATGKVVVLITCASKDQAETIARTVLDRRLAACANILQGPVQSIYRWQGKIESAEEFLMILKTSSARFPALRKEIQRLHSYHVPEIVALPVATGSRDYLSWIADSLGTSSSSGAKS